MAEQIRLRDEDRLPWLETVEPDEEEGPGLARIAAFVVLGLVVLAGIVFAGFTLMNRTGGSAGQGQIIAAQPGDYKVKPDEPGGLQVEGEGDAAIATSAGAKAGQGAIDLNAVPEAPVNAAAPAAAPSPQVVTGDTRTKADVPIAPTRLAAARPMTVPRASIPGAGSGGALVQLGAYPSEAVANAAWSAIAKRFAYVAPLGKEVQAAEVNGRKVYRLRVNAGSAGAASDICGRLKVAGESCFVTS